MCIRMYSYVTRMYPFVLVCYPYVTRMLLVCIRMYPYVTPGGGGGHSHI